MGLLSNGVPHNHSTPLRGAGTVGLAPVAGLPRAFVKAADIQTLFDAIQKDPQGQLPAWQEC